MNNVAGQPKLSKSSESALSSSAYGLPVCPRPRRAVAAVSEFLSPLSCEHSRRRREGDEDGEILDMISGKVDEGRDALGTGCPPCCYCGSPPSRSHNPMVHDVHFIQQMNRTPPWPYTKSF